MFGIIIDVRMRSSVVLTVFFSGICSGFLLDGSTNSYSQFRKWGGGTNGTLEFEFKTDQPNGLLLYTDDGGTYDFFEIKLVSTCSNWIFELLCAKIICIFLLNTF